MALPDLIEIVPLDKPVHAEITVPGSKSITNRALILAALADGEVTLEGALWSEDTQVMVDCLQKLGFDVRVAADPNEFCNRTIIVCGLGGKIPNAGTAERPLELCVGNAGTAARFLSAMVCLGNGVYRLSGVPRMHERPQAALFSALRELGYRVDSSNEKLPAVIHGIGPREGKCRVSIEESSQFASALLLVGELGHWTIETTAGLSDRSPAIQLMSRRGPETAFADGAGEDEMPYVLMTIKLRTVFPRKSGPFQIEPDASSGSYFWASPIPKWPVSQQEITEQVNRLESQLPQAKRLGRQALETMFSETLGVTVANWPSTGWQVDERFPELMRGRPAEISRRNDLGDSIMTAIVIAPLQRREIRFTDLGRLRVQECERVEALRTELTKCGAEIIEYQNTLTVLRSRKNFHGAEIETYNDHRMAMCFAVLGLKVPGIKIKNPTCVKKTFPNFFQKLADAPPRGLGAKILDGHTGRPLKHEELFAE